MQHFLTRPHGSKVLDHWMPPFLATNQVCFHIIDSTLNNSTDCIKKVVRTSAVYQTLPSMSFLNWLCSCELNQMNLMPEPSSIRQFYKALLPSSIQHCTMLRSITVGVIESQIQQIPRFRSFFIQMKNILLIGLLFKKKIRTFFFTGKYWLTDKVKILHKSQFDCPLQNIYYWYKYHSSIFIMQNHTNYLSRPLLHHIQLVPVIGHTSLQKHPFLQTDF